MGKKKIVIYGVGGFGRELAWILSGLTHKYELLGFVDDGDKFQPGMPINGVPFLGKRDWMLAHEGEDIYYNCAIGNTKIKHRVQQELMDQGFRFESIVAADVYIPETTEIGMGCVIYGGVKISVNCRIGDGVLINTDVTIGHDVEIGSYTVISPTTGISGGCKIGSDVTLGGHAFMIPNRRVGDCATVAAGSIVFSNVKAGTTVLGNPAHRMRELE